MASRNRESSSRRASCLCSPTSHPGSFRCSLHRSSRSPARISDPKPQKKRVLDPSLLSKVGAVKAFLMQLIKPSSRHLQRRRNFQPKPTRFCGLNNHNPVAVSWFSSIFLNFLFFFSFLVGLWWEKLCSVNCFGWIHIELWYKIMMVSYFLCSLWLGCRINILLFIFEWKIWWWESRTHANNSVVFV